MKPIFNEQIEMWKNLGACPNDEMIQEGYLWLDKSLIKGFKRDGMVVSLFSYRASDDLSITIQRHKNNNYSLSDLETWQETVSRNGQHLNEIEQKSLNLLKECANTGKTIIDTNSTGKDSMVKTHLAHKAGLKFDTYFNVTTLDVGQSTVMAKELGYKFIFPDMSTRGFYNYVKDNHVMPSRLNRGCCRIFKETPTIEYFKNTNDLIFLFGMRNDESNLRAEYTDVWINYRWNPKLNWMGILPIRQWSEMDIWLYTLRENIPINEKYKRGYARVGCAIACPNYTKTTWVLDKYWYPTLYNRWRKILEEDFKTNYKWLIMNCTLQEYLNGGWTGGTYRNEPTIETIKEFAEYKNIDFDVAAKYFNHRCEDCGHKIKDKNALAMNMKLFGRQTTKFYCKKHLMKMFNLSDEAWNQKIAEFKQGGCQLF